VKLPTEFTAAISLVLVIAVLLAFSLGGIAVSAWQQHEGATSVLFGLGSAVCVYAAWRILLIALGVEHGY
jgi:hypothetical protein